MARGRRACSAPAGRRSPAVPPRSTGISWPNTVWGFPVDRDGPEREWGTDLTFVSYEGRRVIVSGGGGAGMGAAVVRQLEPLGAEIHVIDLKEPPIEVAGY